MLVAVTAQLGEGMRRDKSVIEVWHRAHASRTSSGITPVDPAVIETIGSKRDQILRTRRVAPAHRVNRVGLVVLAPSFEDTKRRLGQRLVPGWRLSIRTRLRMIRRRRACEPQRGDGPPPEWSGSWAGRENPCDAPLRFRRARAMKLDRLKINRFRNVKPATELRFDAEWNVLLGKNGAGKTTLLKLITCVLRSDVEPLANEEFDVEYDLLFAGGARVTCKMRNEARQQPMRPKSRVGCRAPRAIPSGSRQRRASRSRIHQRASMLSATRKGRS